MHSVRTQNIHHLAIIEDAGILIFRINLDSRFRGNDNYGEIVIYQGGFS
jgi:hypothetical protein